VQAHALEERLQQQQQLQQSGQQQPSQQLSGQQQQHLQQSLGSEPANSSSSRQVSAATSSGRYGSGPGASVSPWPSAAAFHPYAGVEGLQPAQVNSYSCQKSFKVCVAVCVQRRGPAQAL
jgi:hypothetical protein